MQIQEWGVLIARIESLEAQLGALLGDSEGLEPPRSRIRPGPPLTEAGVQEEKALLLHIEALEDRVLTLETTLAGITSLIFSEENGLNEGDEQPEEVVVVNPAGNVSISPQVDPITAESSPVEDDKSDTPDNTPDSPWPRQIV